MTTHKVGNKSGKTLRRGLGSGRSIIVPSGDIVQTIQTSKLRRGLGRNIQAASGGSGNTVAGFQWQQKDTDFIASSNIGYECDTSLDNVLLTLPDTPSNGDNVAFFATGVNQIRFTTEDNIKGSPIGDFVKTVSTEYLIIILNYINSTTGWDWNSRYNAHIGSLYIGLGYQYWRFSWNGTLSEIQFDLGDNTPRTLTTPNGVSSISQVANFNLAFPSFSAISDGTLGQNNQYIGYVPSGGATFCKMQANFSSSISIGKIYLAPQGTNANYPTTFIVEVSSDGTNWSNLITLNNINNSLIGDQLVAFTL